MQHSYLAEKLKPIHEEIASRAYNKGRKDATKRIREVYDKYKDKAEHSYLEFSELWQAIKKTRDWYIRFIEDEEKRT